MIAFALNWPPPVDPATGGARESNDDIMGKGFNKDEHSSLSHNPRPSYTARL